MQSYSSQAILWLQIPKEASRDSTYLCYISSVIDKSRATKKNKNGENELKQIREEVNFRVNF